jgi:hypothetical protein
MKPGIKKTLVTLLFAAGMGGASLVVHSAPPELNSYAKTYERWFDDAAAEFNVPVELLHAIAYAETRWKPIVPPGYAKKTSEPVMEVERHAGDMPPVYGIMGLRNDTYFGTSLNQAAALIGVPPANLLTDSRANIRGAAALLAKLGNGKDRFTPLEQWEDALAKFSGIPQREIAELHTYEMLNAVHGGRSSNEYKIKQRHVDLEKIYGKEKLQKLSAPRIAVQFDDNGTTISVPNGTNN